MTEIPLNGYVKQQIMHQYIGQSFSTHHTVNLRFLKRQDRQTVDENIIYIKYAHQHVHYEKSNEMRKVFLQHVLR